VTDRAPGDTAAAETRDVPAAPPPPPAPRPFSRPTPIDGGRAAAAERWTPFVAPGSRKREEQIAVERPTQPRPQPMTWPGAAELDAAHALDAIARRLRSGSLRLPLVVDGASQPAVVAAVLAALHMEGPGRPDPRADGRSSG